MAGFIACHLRDQIEPIPVDALRKCQRDAGSIPATSTIRRRPASRDYGEMSRRSSKSEGGLETPKQMSDAAQAEFPSHLVYILRSRNDRERFYVGYTNDLPGRLLKHNRGESGHTAKYAPWEIVWFSAFTTRTKARAFETYLKSGSGRAFQKRHLSPDRA